MKKGNAIIGLGFRCLPWTFRAGAGAQVEGRILPMGTVCTQAFRTAVQTSRQRPGAPWVIVVDQTTWLEIAGPGFAAEVASYRARSERSKCRGGLQDPENSQGMEEIQKALCHSFWSDTNCGCSPGAHFAETILRLKFEVFFLDGDFFK